MSCGFRSPSSFQYGLLIWTHMREYQAKTQARRTIEPQMVIELMEQFEETVLPTTLLCQMSLLSRIQFHSALLLLLFTFAYITYITCVQVVV